MSAHSFQIKSFLANGGRASQFELARMYGISNTAVRSVIRDLRTKYGMSISKVLHKDRPNEAYYQLVPENVTPRRGRPAHKFAVQR